MMKNREEGVMAVRKAEIDTRAPFTSVKEAVSLFGDKVLAGHVYANPTYLKHQSGEKENYWKIGEVAAELKETRENLERAREESMLMAHCLSSLQEELERTKRELQQLKQMSETEKHVDVHPAAAAPPPPPDDEIEEDVKFVENLTTFQFKSSRFEDEFQKKRYVTFANPPSESHHHHHHVMLQPPLEKLERHPSLRRNTKKSFIPLIGAIFSRKKPTQH